MSSHHHIGGFSHQNVYSDDSFNDEGFNGFRSVLDGEMKSIQSLTPIQRRQSLYLKQRKGYCGRKGFLEIVVHLTPQVRSLICTMIYHNFYECIVFCFKELR